MRRSLVFILCGLIAVVSGRKEGCVTSSGAQGECRVPTACVGVSLQYLEDNQCETSQGLAGACCLDLVENKLVKIVDGEREVVELPIISASEVRNFIKQGSQTNKNVKKQSTSTQASTKPADFHQKFNSPRKLVKKLDQDASFFLEVTKQFQGGKNLTSKQTVVGLRALFSGDTNSDLDQRCPWRPQPSCNGKHKYRSFDGTCNNLKKPNLGRTGTPFQRILVPDYFQSIDLPRTTAGGSALPSSRDISNTLAGGSGGAKDHDNTVLLMQLGQFIDHDLTHTPSAEATCCSSGGTFPSQYNPDECFPIRIKHDDPFWRGSATCMEFSRSLKSPDLNCELGTREQPNQITHWLDGSNIYGSTDDEAAKLRGRGGKLKISRQRDSRHGYLPTCQGKEEGEVHGCDLCSGENKKESCYFAGDFRVNEQLNLIVMHTIFMREHNRVAEALEKLNPCWSDEKLYQEARRIVVAQYQHVVYKEWLPAVLGNEFMDVYGLWTLSSGYSSDYADDFDARINNEFAAAAFRFGHSLIPITFSIDSNKKPSAAKQNMKLKEMFFSPDQMRQPRMLEDLMHGMMQQESQASDSSFVEDIRNHLFESNSGAGGLDLVALNIQRGRDHGIPGYNKYREICGIGKATQWKDLRKNMKRADVQKLRQLYRSIDDIDLYVGGVLENHHRDSLVGAVFKCIIGDQFARLKKGDRYFYDLGTDPSTAFTPDQLQEIRKTSLARMICDNTDRLDRIQPFVIKTPHSRANAMRSCGETSIPDMDLSVFKDSCGGSSANQVETNSSANQVNAKTCFTEGGPSSGAKCVFPFRYKKTLFRGCTRIDDPDEIPWCSTKTDAKRNHVGGEGNWGYCGNNCKNHE